MDLSNKPILIVIAGPNGSGKTTLYETRIRTKIAEQNVSFINADMITLKLDNQGFIPKAGFFSQISPQVPLLEKFLGNSIAAISSKLIREELIYNKVGFVTETVFSHVSKLDLIKEAINAGYFVILNHVHLDPVELAVKRVEARVQQGGHDVPVDRIKKRYFRSLELIPRAAALSDVTYIWDNSLPLRAAEQKRAYSLVSRISKVEGITTYVDKVPSWVKAHYPQIQS